MTTIETVPIAFRGASGVTYLRGSPLGEPGATGSCWSVRRLGGDEDLVLKLFHARFCTAATRQRIAALTAARLDRAAPGLCAPFDAVDGPIGLGHVSARAPGRDVETYLTAPNSSFVDHLVAAGAIAASVATLERRNIAHGDLHAKNVFLERRDGVLRATLIDFDNFVAPAMPLPFSIGQISYYAPEIRRDPRPVRVSAATDRYALAVLLHELLLARHPASGACDDPDRFHLVMAAGGWPDDPAGSPHPRGDDGFPVDCLDTRLQNLMRRGLASDPAVRPSPAEWLKALRHAVENVYACDECRRPFLVDGGKTACPHCRSRFGDYHLHIAARPPVVLRREPVSLTRRHFREEAARSCHAVLRRRGPDAILEPTGRVAISRVGPGGPTPLEPRQAHLLQPGDRLRFGDVEAEVRLGSPP